MDEVSFPFRSINGDRKYPASVWTDFFKAVYNNGVIPYGNELEVSAGTGMQVILDTGFAIIEGASYRNPSALAFDVDPADGVNDRIDSIFLRRSTSNRKISAVYVAGVAASTPTAPALTQDEDGDFEYSRADIYVTAGVTEITDEDISDGLLDDARCPVATVRLEIGMEGFQAQMNALIAHLEQEISDAEGGTLYELKRLQFLNTIVPVASFVSRDLKDGENMCDEVFEQGTLNDSTGAEESSADHIRMTNDIPVTAGESYAYSDSAAGGARLFWFSDSAFISYSDVSDGGYATAPTGATKMRVRIAGTSIVPADIDWCMVNYGAEAAVRVPYVDVTDYPYQAKITLSGVIANMVPEIMLDAYGREIACPDALSYNGGLKIFASDTPSKSVIIQTLHLWKAVN